MVLVRPEERAQGGDKEEGERSIFTVFVPLLAAFTMAIFFPALTLSRYGSRAMLFVPISVFAVYAFWRGVDAAENRWQTTDQENTIPF